MRMNEKDKSVIFAADVFEWYKAYFMKTNFDDLIRWAGNASEKALLINPNPKFALLISCTARKLVLRQRVTEEIEEIYDIIWKNCKIGGFYSYGEIWAKNSDEANFFLHNQTMTVVLISEE
jgi:hypothetical protein